MIFRIILSNGEREKEKFAIDVSIHIVRAIVITIQFY